MRFFSVFILGLIVFSFFCFAYASEKDDELSGPIMIAAKDDLAKDKIERGEFFSCSEAANYCVRNSDSWCEYCKGYYLVRFNGSDQVNHALFIP